jgi:cob(I)alamin adenosyltransferase
VSIATRGGDSGTTGLLHGQRVAKDHPQIEAVGAFDELNVEIGGARLFAAGEEARALLLRAQACLVALMGELACAEEDSGRHAASALAKLGEPDLAALDAAVAALESRSIRMGGWATPGATPEALAFDRARVAARRAERRLAALAGSGRSVRPLCLKWVNRLSDVLWLLAREAETLRPGANSGT